MENLCKSNGAWRWGVFFLAAVALIVTSLYSNGLFGHVNLGLHRYVLSLISESKGNETQDSFDTSNSESIGSKFPLDDTNMSQGLPTLRTMAEDLQRSKDPCPKEVSLKGWNGRIGNHYFQVSQVLVFAMLCGMSSVSFPAPVLNRKVYQSQAGMLLMPRKVDLPGSDVTRFLPLVCPKHWKNADWYHQVCSGVSAWRYWQVMQVFLRPYLGPNLTEREQQVTPSSDHMLTVHLRGDDVNSYPHMAMSQPPCSLYRRIISEHRYDSVTLIFGGRSPACAGTFMKDLKDVIQLHIPAESTIVNHFAILLRAKHLFLAFSSFSVAAALLSKEVKVLYRRTGVKWEAMLHSNLNCDLWPGVVMYEYKAHNIPLTELKEGGPTRWLQEFPIWNFSGPWRCKYGLQEGDLMDAANFTGGAESSAETRPESTTLVATTSTSVMATSTTSTTMTTTRTSTMT